VTTGITCALAVAVVPGAVSSFETDAVTMSTHADSVAAWSWSEGSETWWTRPDDAGRASRGSSSAVTAARASVVHAAQSVAAVPTATSASASATGTMGGRGSDVAARATGLLGAGSGAVGGVLASASELASRPTSGAAWVALLAAANERSGSVDLADQDSTHAAQTLAAALVYARTGDSGQHAHVVSVLQQLPGSSLSGARVLSVSRQLAGYVLAADLIGYRETGFRSWIGGMRTEDVGNHGRWTTIAYTSEDSANNWGTWAMSTRIAISAYLGDAADLQRAAAVFRGFTGERSGYAGFRQSNDFDANWACGEAWVPINPAGCGDRSGAIVEDISRSAGSYPSVDDTGLTYSWEVLGGATLSARLLERAGYTDVWQWGDRALLRAATFLRDRGGFAPRHDVNQYIPHEINAAYGTNLGPVGSAGYGRQFGFTDWLA
jgi:hypothetical protein